MALLSFAVVVSGLPNAQPTTGWFSIKAFLPNWKGCPVELKIDGQTFHTDTIRKDVYSLVDSIGGIHEGLFQIKKDGKVVALPLFVEPGTIRINDKGYRQLTASGSVTNDAYQHLVDHITASALINYGYDYDKVNAYKSKLCIDFIKQHSRSVLSLHLLKYYPFLSPRNDSLYLSLYNGLDNSLKGSYLGNQIGSAIRVDNKIVFGKTIPNLQLPDTLNQLSFLYEGDKYTLLDFWASWCTPCREQNAALVNIFRSYHAKGFTIVSVSLDTDKKRWLDAIEQDKLTWKHLSELKGWESSVVKTFAISAVPMNILLDSKGTIVAKNLQMQALQSLLTQILP